MQQPIGLLSDNINWVQPLARAMDAAGVPSLLIPFPHPPFTEFDGHAYPKVIFNRVAIRAAKGSPGIVTLVRDLLSALQLQDKHIINNRHCHHVGSSKALQALVFERAGVMSPKTLVLHDKDMLTKAREQMPDGLLKSNVGGFGAGVWTPESPDQDVPKSILAAAFAADGVAVWQQRYIPRDDVIYRVEMLDGEVLYRARVPIKPHSFNYCLGNAGSFSGPGIPDDPVSLDPAPETKLRAALAKICRLANMVVGSVEYLIPKGESAACFFDINPVSTYHPKAAALLGFDPYKKVAERLKELCQSN
ncbi:MAG: hypothetical protein PVG84_04260 [Desulfobacterales bacterium]|jgi:hypothetical protein